METGEGIGRDETDGERMTEKGELERKRGRGNVGGGEND